MDQERLSLLALHFVPGIGDVLCKQLVSYCGSASQVFAMPKGKLLKIPGIGPISAEAVAKGKSMAQAEVEFKKAEREDATILFYVDAAYPARLKVIEDAPVVLYCKGNVNLNTPKVVALVGTRKATDYGKGFIDKLMETLVPHEPLILSGLAYGIDIHAHKQALLHNLTTVGVLGSGLDVIYPAAHKDTVKRMFSGGGIITENPFGAKPDAHNFPARNRIIAGLCDALIVVEAAESGGALITANIANSYNKDVFALPGNYNQEYSTGCNQLIKTNKASVITGIKDLEYVMNWQVGDAAKDKKPLPLFDLLPEEKIVIDILKDRQAPISIDELTLKSGLNPGTLATHVLSLELRNIVKTLPGKFYKLS
jgi:DNA processing protein